MEPKVYTSTAITENYEQLIKDCDRAYRLFNHFYNPEGIEDMPTQAHYTTDNGQKEINYNIFTLTATRLSFYNLYKDLCEVIRDYLGEDIPLWVNAWINYDKYGKTLNWHGHNYPYHGYISIDPKKTITEFDGWSVENKIGNIYIGEGGPRHKVNVLEPYDGYRITIGFDILTEPNEDEAGTVCIPVL